MLTTVYILYVEFIHLIASESNDIADRETKKTIAGEHIVSALKELGFDEYVDDVEDVYKEHRQQQKVPLLFFYYKSG